MGRSPFGFARGIAPAVADASSWRGQGAQDVLCQPCPQEVGLPLARAYQTPQRPGFARRGQRLAPACEGALPTGKKPSAPPPTKPLAGARLGAAKNGLALGAGVVYGGRHA